MRNAPDPVLLNYIYHWLCTRLNRIYQEYLLSHELESRHSLNLPTVKEDICKELSHVIWLNHIGDSDILRTDINTPLFQMRTKHLYNRATNESLIHFIDFHIHKIQLRGGGFGSRIVNTIFDMQKVWLSAKYQIDNVSTRMVAFKFLSIPFWMKNDFEFKWMVDNKDGEQNDWNVTYKFFKLLTIMNNLQDLNLCISNAELFSMSAIQINEMLSRWVTSYKSKVYNQNLWIKSQIIDHVGTKCCEDVGQKNNEFCSKTIYKSICSQLVNDYIMKLEIFNIMWELFYIEKKVI